MHLELLGGDYSSFPTITDSTAVTSLRMVGCRFSAEPVSQFGNLVGLEISGLRDASLDFLARVSGLRYLRIIHLPKVSDLKPIEDLGNLQVLRLETLPSWDASSKRQLVGSIQPIAALPCLRHLELFSVIPEDRSLAPLESARSLASVRIQGYPKKEISRFFAATGLPDDFAPDPPWA